MQNDIKPSNQSQELNYQEQGRSSSPRSARDKHVSTWGTSRETQSGAHSNEQHDQKGAKPGEEPWGSFVKRLPPEIQDIILKEKLLVVLCEDLLDRGNCHRYPRQFEAMMDIVPEMDRQAAAKELVKRLGRQECAVNIQLRIVRAIEMLGEQSVIPDLIEKSSDVKDNSKELRAAIYGTIGILGGRSELAKMLSSGQVEWMAKYSLEWAVKLSENPSAGQELTQELANVLHERYEGKYGAISCLAGKFGDVSVARELVQELGQEFSRSKGYPTDYTHYISNAIGDVARRLDNPAEVKEISDTLVKMVPQANFRLVGEIVPAIGELGKKLAKLVGPEASTSKGQGLVKREDVKKLSKDLVHMLAKRRLNFFERRFEDYERDFYEWNISKIANAIFEIEQCLAEPDSFKRFLNREEVNRKVSDSIAAELVEYRQKIQPPPQVFSRKFSEFDEMLVDMVSLPEIMKDMRHSAYHALGKIDDLSLMIKLKQKFYDNVKKSEYKYSPILEAIRHLEKEPFMSKLFKVLSPTLFNEGEKQEMADQILRSSIWVPNIEEFAEKLTYKYTAGPTRKVMARLTGIVGKPSLVPKLVEMLSYGKIDSDGVCGGIADAIGKLGQKLVEPAEIKEFCGQLVDVLPKTNENTRRKLISVIEKLGDESTVLKLARKLDNGEIDISVRKEIFELAQRLLVRDA